MSGLHNGELLYSWFRVAVLGLVSTVPVLGQVVTDGTVGAVTTLSGPQMQVTADLGTARGGNLFHSFRSFSIPSGQSAVFSGPAEIANVISRVTGGEASTINGRLACTIPAADFFFLNPAGVVFGSGAEVDVNGEFHVSGAQYLTLGESGRFDAVEPANDVLVSAPPEAFGFLPGSAGDITLSECAIRTAEGEAVSLTGANIRLNGAELTVPGGSLAIAAVASEGELGVADPEVADFANLGRVRVADDARVTVAGSGADSGPSLSGGSRVRIVGDGLEMRSGGQVQLVADMDFDGGIEVATRGLVKIDGEGRRDVGTGLFCTAGGSVPNASIRVSAERLHLLDGGQIGLSMAVDGECGPVSIDVDSLRVESQAAGVETQVATIVSADALVPGSADIGIRAREIDVTNSGSGSTAVVRSTVTGNAAGPLVAIRASESVRVDGHGVSGEAGVVSGGTGSGRCSDIAIETPELALRNGGTVATFAEGPGDCGDIALAATSIRLEDGASGAGSTAVASLAGGGGASGRIRVDADLLEIAFSSTEDPCLISWGFGGNGDIELTCDAIRMQGGWISSTALNSDPEARGGDVRIETRVLAMQGGARIDAGSASACTGGDVRIDATEISLAQQSRIITPSLGTGPAGNVRIRANDLSLAGGALVLASTQGAGDAGSILIAADRLAIDSAGSDEMTGILSQSLDSEGRGGDIELSVADLSIEGGMGMVSSATSGRSRAGDVRVVASARVRVAGPADSPLAGISTETRWHDGSAPAGDIAIEAPRLEVVRGGRISSSTVAVGDGGDIGLSCGEVLIEGGGLIRATTGGPGTAGDVRVAVDGLTIRGGSDDAGEITGISASSLGETVGGNAGTISVDAGSVQLSGKGATLWCHSISTGAAGEIDIVTDRFEMDGGAEIRTSAEQTGKAGSIGVAVEGPLRSAGGEIACTAVNGVAGNVTLESEQRIELTDTRVSVSSSKNQAGTISLLAPESIRLVNSPVSAEAWLDGGNILVDPTWFGLEDSPLNANSAWGEGGRITIFTDFMYQMGHSPITADSEHGSPGTVAVNRTEDFSERMDPLPDAMVRPEEQLREGCSRRNPGYNTFIFRGSGGVPPRPDGFLPLTAFFSEQWLNQERRDALVSTLCGDFGHEAVLAERLAELRRVWKGDEDAQVEARVGAALGLAFLHQGVGDHRAAVQWADRAVSAALHSERGEVPARVRAGKAVVLLYAGRLDAAAEEREAARADGFDEAADVAMALDFALLDALRGETERALAACLGASKRIRESGGAELAAAAVLHEARIWRIAGEPLDVAEVVNTIREHLANAQSKGMAGYLGLCAVQYAVASGAPELVVAEPESTGAETAGERRLQSVPWGPRSPRVLGDFKRLEVFRNLLDSRLAEATGRLDEAQHLAEQAVRGSQLLGDRFAEFEAQWCTARLLRMQGNAGAALTHYERAVESLRAVRHDLTLGYVLQNGAASFRDGAGRIYFELAELLVERYRENPSEELLAQVRDGMESFKNAELEAYYLSDDCVDLLKAQRRSAEGVDPRAATLYPVLLPESTEVLVFLPSGVRLHSVPVGAEAMNGLAAEFRINLQNRITHQYRRQAAKLYDLLVRPIETWLEEEEVETVVFVPDGQLRTVPLAALHDGERFLVERWAVAVTPGLSLMDPRALESGEQPHAVLAGIGEAVQGFSALPHARAEVDQVALVMGGDRLLDHEFLAPRLQESVLETDPRVVHIATHGQFGRTEKDSFLLTYDERLDMGELRALIQPTLLRPQPIELLALSACQTAAGDDRAALGLAGVAVRSGARSALATLWYVNDETSAALVSDFYAELIGERRSKAASLRAAQVRLLRDPRYAHPCYWSPYLILGNWL